MSPKPDRAYQPDFAVPPGETIKELATEKHMSIFALEQALYLCMWEVLDLCDGRLKISQTLAKDLEKVFNMPADFWLNLQAQYDETKKREGKK